MKTYLAPPFEPSILLGLALRAVPASIIDRLVQKLSDDIQQKHTGLFERLGDIDCPSWLIEPLDLPYVFYLSLGEDKLLIQTYAKDDILPEAAAHIRASIENLLKMTDGQSDGDALFFSRDLSISGSTEAVVALRNAMDASGINLEEEIMENLGLLKPVAKKGLPILLSLYNKAKRDMQLIQSSITTELQQTVIHQNNHIARLNQEVADLKSSLGKAKLRTSRSRSSMKE